MNKNREIKEHVELLSKNNSGLYALCILVGVITGITVSLYRYGLSLAGSLREHYINPELLANPTKLFLIWVLFISIGAVVDFLYKKFPITGGSGIPQVKALILKKLDYVF